MNQGLAVWMMIGAFVLVSSAQNKTERVRFAAGAIPANSTRTIGPGGFN